jgi:ring-1,2-phenylacetyl-CoA epoxidase subunit PaaC
MASERIVSTPATDATGAVVEQRFRYVLRMADANLILAQRLGELVGHAPALEEDLGLANIALDLLGQARLLLSYAGEVEGKGRTEDALAFLREHREFMNPTLVEQPNGDFGQIIVRQFLFDAWQLEMHERLASSADVRLAEIAAKALKETRYHFRYSSNWLIRLGDGTRESHERVQAALAMLWPFTFELFAADEIDTQMLKEGIAPDLGALRDAWNATVNRVLAEATLQRPQDKPYLWLGKHGKHSEHLGRILAEMQYMQRTYPGAQW